MTPTTFAARAAHFRAAADEALRAGDFAEAATATAFATRCEQARTSGTLHSESNDPILDPEDCCIACGEHFSDPHAPQCPHADSDLGEDQEGEVFDKYEQRAARYWVAAQHARADGDSGHAAELEDLAGQCQQWVTDALTAAATD